MNPIECVVYRCSKQQDMYVYLRADLLPADLPAALRARTGSLSQVMLLELTPQKKLARVDVQRVMAELAGPGYYLQLPPNGLVEAYVNYGGG
ncbi:YcgL domain-containing protein [Hydrocarboniphaga sp.]|uniref:YcgL domain-containing protein n=1 Tax=Hydrocarboniphaga sp. TaxID=2033016 RepID=UPI003D10E1A9